jgi:2-keto-3-deoxy-L-fuconate dehydrogenase
VAILFARQGARVHALDINTTQAGETVKEIQDQGGQASAHVADVSNQQEVLAFFSSLERVDILVNSAGISHVGTVETTQEEDFDRLFSVNVKGVYNCLHAAIPVMKKNKGGVILNMGSVAASVGLPDRFAYSMTKGAVSAMTLSVAKDYIRENIRCNSISPARVHTPFVDGFLKKNYPGKETEMYDKLSKTQPIGRMARPDEIAALILYLCSEEASFITGCDYPIDGGFLKLNN